MDVLCREQEPVKLPSRLNIEVFVEFDYLDREDGMVIEVLYAPEQKSLPMKLGKQSLQVPIGSELRTVTVVSEELGAGTASPAHQSKGSIKGIPNGPQQYPWKPKFGIVDIVMETVLFLMMIGLPSYLLIVSFVSGKGAIAISVFGTMLIGVAIFGIWRWRQVYLSMLRRPPNLLRIT